MDKVFTFRDVIKNSILNLGEFGKINTLDIISTLLVTLLVSLFVFFVYTKTYKGVSYNNSFNISLIMVSLITSMIILTISTNVVLSLGMVGALSIVRFRTPIKEAFDIVFMFWAIAIGISSGARFYLLSIVGSIFIGLVLMLLTRFTYESNKYLLIIHCEKQSMDAVLEKLQGLKYQVKSKTATSDKVELSLEMKLKSESNDISEQISSIPGVTSTILVKTSISSDI
jgi:uncharacterized membrane protein YhiD involved in acid resistance